MRQWLAQCGLQAQVGFAGNLDMACLAARAATDVLVLQENDGHEAALLHQLPLTVLQPSANVTGVLQLWGIRTLADLINLPRADIADHLGLTVETVSRCLTALRNRGLIALPGTYRVDILDQGGLEMLKAA